jgi:pyruvate dehydrogenase E1 component beta subunit
VFKVTAGLSAKYGSERVRTTPISEQAILGAAIGAALAGMRPVAEIMLMNFIAVAMDQITNHAAKLRYMSGGATAVPLTVRTASGAGMQFGAQHSEMLEAWFTHVPGLNVIVPSNAADAKGLLTASIRNDDPCIFVEQTRLYATKGDVPSGDHVVPLGRAKVARQGADVSVVTYGLQVNEAVAAAERLAEEGIEVEVVDLRTLVPLDLDTVLDSVARTRRAVVAHEAVERSGFGAELAASISHDLFGQLLSPVVRVAGRNTPIPYARELEGEWLPNSSRLQDAIRTMLHS